MEKKQVTKWNQLQTIQRSEDVIINNNVNYFTGRVENVLSDVRTKLIVMIEEYKTTHKTNVIDFEMLLQDKVRIENLLYETGYYDYVTDFIAAESKIIDKIAAEYAIFNHKLRFTDTSMIAIKELQKNSIVTFQGIGQKATNMIYKGLYSSLLTTIPYDETIKNLSKIIDETDLKKYAKTYANTSYMRFNRTVNAVTSQDTGWNNFLYSGPIDGKMRPFCAVHIGETRDKENIQKMDNGQTSNVFIDGGGYNCRHKWNNVPPDFKLSEADTQGIKRQMAIVEEQKLLKAA